MAMYYLLKLKHDDVLLSKSSDSDIYWKKL